MSSNADPCREGHVFSTYRLYDARRIYCGRVCERCEDYKRAQFAPEIFNDSGYAHDEPIDSE